MERVKFSSRCFYRTRFTYSNFDATLKYWEISSCFVELQNVNLFSVLKFNTARKVFVRCYISEINDNQQFISLVYWEFDGSYQR